MNRLTDAELEAMRVVGDVRDDYEFRADAFLALLQEVIERRAADAKVRELIKEWRKYADDVGGKDAFDEGTANGVRGCACDLEATILPTQPHDSDCSQHNAPAYPAGECDCSFSTTLQERR